MAQGIRSRASARAARTTLYLVQAKDHILNRPTYSISLEAATEAILRHPNMNTTGHLPGIAMLHIGMRARLTLPVEALVAPVDATGTVKDIILDPREPAIEGAPSVHVLHYMPLAVLFQMDDSDAELLPPKYCTCHQQNYCDFSVPSRECPECDFFPGQLYIVPKLNPQRFKVPVRIQQPGQRVAATWELTVQREQIPLTTITASTLHTLSARYHRRPWTHLSLDVPTSRRQDDALAECLRGAISPAIFGATPVYRPHGCHSPHH